MSIINKNINVNVENIVNSKRILPHLEFLKAKVPFKKFNRTHSISISFNQKNQN